MTPRSLNMTFGEETGINIVSIVSHSGSLEDARSNVGGGAPGEITLVAAISLILTVVMVYLLVIHLYRRCHRNKNYSLQFRAEPKYSDDEEIYNADSSKRYWQFLHPWRICVQMQLLTRFGLLQSVNQRILSWFTKIILWFKPATKPRNKPQGLWNIGNTCYFNSVMQVLISSNSLQLSKYMGSKNMLLTSSVQELFNVSRDLKCSKAPSNRRSIQEIAKDVHAIFTSRAKRFHGFQQQDSHECLRHLLDELRKEEREHRKNSVSIPADETNVLTIVDSVFGGHFVTVYICQECGIPYHLFEPFLDISLPICIRRAKHEADFSSEVNMRTSNSKLLPYTNAVKDMMIRLGQECAAPARVSTQGRTQPSIDDCLWYYTRLEHIQDDYLCNNCQKDHINNGGTDTYLTSATKQTLIFNPPAVLTIHLKRFELKSGGFVKCNDHVTYSEFLDLSTYCSTYCLRNEPPSRNLWFSLYGVIVHSGTLEFGHYIAYVKVRKYEENVEKFFQKEYFERNVSIDQLTTMIRASRGTAAIDHWIPREQDEDKWYCMNDNRVSEVSRQEALSQDAYLLFYERLSRHESSNIIDV